MNYGRALRQCKATYCTVHLATHIYLQIAIGLLWAVLSFRRIDFGVLPWRLLFDPRPHHVEFLVGTFDRFFCLYFGLLLSVSRLQ